MKDNHSIYYVNCAEKSCPNNEILQKNEENQNDPSNMSDEHSNDADSKADTEAVEKVN